MGKKINVEDIIGNKYNMLMVTGYAGKREDGKHYYECLCECGNTAIVRRGHLMNGETRSCGCICISHANVKDLLGKRFGKLVVKKYLGYIPYGGKQQSAYLCQCECGKEATIMRHDLVADLRRSCGDCWRIEEENDYYRYYCADGGSFIFDKEDYDLITERKWHISNKGYAVSTAANSSERLDLHRYLMKPEKGQIVDHVNRDTRDNRRSNLRMATPRTNQYNKVVQRISSTGYKGVTRIRRNGGIVYRASIRVDGKRMYLGSSFKTPEDAARAYDDAARFYFGEFACVNFPFPVEQCCRRNQEAV